MSEYGEGVRTGYSTVSQANPFSAYIKRVDEARARQLADQKDVQELKQLFETMSKQHEYATAIEKQKSEIGLQLEKEKGVQDRLTKLSEGYTFDEAGNPTEQTSQPTQPSPQAQPVDRNQRLLQMTGLAMPTSNYNKTQQTLYNNTGKKSVVNPDNSGISSERSITVQIDADGNKKWMNLPTIVDGIQLSRDEAIKRAFTTKHHNGIFNSEQEAVSAAENRSRWLDKQSGGEGILHKSPKEWIPDNSNSMLAEQFGLGKGVKLRKKENATSAVSLTPEESLTKISQGEDPEDYIPKPMVRKVNNEATEIYLAEKKQKVPAKQLDDLRLLGINASDLSRNLEMKKIKGIDTGPSIINRPGVIADIIGNLQGKKDLLSFKAEVDKAFQKYRKETTGVQAGYKELNWLAPDFPKVTDEDAVFIQKSEDAINTVKINQEMFLDYLKDNGYAVGKLRKSILGEKSSGDPEYDKMKQLIGQ